MFFKPTARQHVFIMSAAEHDMPLFTEPASPSSTSSSSARGSRASFSARRRIAAFGRTLPSPAQAAGRGIEEKWFPAGPRPDPVAARAMARRARRAASLETAVLRRRAGGTPSTDRLVGDGRGLAAVGSEPAGHRRTGSSGSVLDEGRHERSTSLRERFTTIPHEDTAMVGKPPVVSPAVHWSRRAAVMATRPSGTVAARGPAGKLPAARPEGGLRQSANAVPQLDAGDQMGEAVAVKRTASPGAAQTVAKQTHGASNGAGGALRVSADTQGDAVNTADKSDLTANAAKSAAHVDAVASADVLSHVGSASDPSSGSVHPHTAAGTTVAPAMQLAFAADGAEDEEQAPSLLHPVPASVAADPTPGLAAARAAPRDTRTPSPLRRHASLPAAESPSPPRPEWQEVGMSTGAAPMPGWTLTVIRRTPGIASSSADD